MIDPLIVILMGSEADLPHSKAIADAARALGLDAILRVGSAHKTPQHVLEMLGQYEADLRPKVYITVAGRSDALSGLTDGAVSAPVIACPPANKASGWLDIVSSLRMPSGVAPAVILDPANAALFAAKILGIYDPAIRNKVVEFQDQKVKRTKAADESVKGLR